MIYITGDTHGDFLDHRFNGSDNILKDLTENDYLIVCGDFGFSWDKQTVSEWNNVFKRKYTTLFCCGNHENYDILSKLETKKMFGDTVKVFGENTFQLLNGHMYNIENQKFFVFGGAASIDKPWRIAEESRTGSPRALWWSDEIPTEDDFELAKQTLVENNYKFDYFITHTCRPELKRYVLNSYKADFYDPTENMIASLEYEIEQNKGNYKAHFFGHFHCNEDYQKEHCLYGKIINISNNTCFINNSWKYKFYNDERDNPDCGFLHPENYNYGHDCFDAQDETLEFLNSLEKK